MTAGDQVDEIPATGQPVTIHSTPAGHDVQNEDIMEVNTAEETLTHDSIYNLIATQSQSHQEILQHVELSIDEHELEEILAEPAPVWLASDGGAVPGWGSYGWAIQIGQRIIARSKGPAHGPHP
jgi:hypothetical protein